MDFCADDHSDYMYCGNCENYEPQKNGFGHCNAHAFGDSFDKELLLIASGMICPDSGLFEASDECINKIVDDSMSDSERYGLKCGVDYPATLF